MSDAAAGGRRCELAARLAEVQDRIAAACADAGRDPAGVRLVVVTKFFPVGDLELLAELGVADVGESRDQEASAKLAGLTPERRRRPARALHRAGAEPQGRLGGPLR